MQTNTALKAALLSLLLMAACANGASTVPAPFRPGPAVDARGYIDVWALRRDVIAVEALAPTAYEDDCFQEGDPEAPPAPPEQIERERRARDACVAEANRGAKRYEAAKKDFNRAWIPSMKAAIAKGDLVAEVIFTLCETTEILDRGDAATTCHQEKRSAALARLREIGFAAAYETCDFKIVGWNRTFRFCTGEFSVWHTDTFGALRLNRSRALTPGYLTWGRELHYGGGAEPYFGRIAAWPGEEAKLAKDLEIDRILKQEPRWSVFLLTRVGRHEWVPERSSSVSGQLDPAWRGRYRLVQGSESWVEPLVPMTGSADIDQVDGEFRVTMRSGAAAPLADVTGCRLRYSGGLTYLPEITPSGMQSAQRTSLGYFYEGGGWKAGSFSDDGAADKALAPLDAKKRYRQVLMQCAEGEVEETPRLRFLLLAGDTLLEFAADAPYGTRHLSVRHFRRLP